MASCSLFKYDTFRNSEKDPRIEFGLFLFCSITGKGKRDGVVNKPVAVNGLFNDPDPIYEWFFVLLGDFPVALKGLVLWKWDWVELS